MGGGRRSARGEIPTTQNIPHDIKYQIPAPGAASSASGRPFGALCLPQRSSDVSGSMVLFVFVGILQHPFFIWPQIHAQVISETDLYKVSGRPTMSPSRFGPRFHSFFAFDQPLVTL